MLSKSVFRSRLLSPFLPVVFASMAYAYAPVLAQDAPQGAPQDAGQGAGQVATPSAQPDAPAVLPPPPLAAYGQLPSIETVDLSPDGRRVAAVASGNGSRQLVVLNEGGKKIGAIPLTNQKIRSIQWAGNDFLIVNMTITDRLWPGAMKQEFGVTSVLNLAAGGKPYWVFDKRNDMLAAVGGSYGIRQIDGRWYAYWGGYYSASAREGNFYGDIDYILYQVDLETGKPKKIAMGDPDWAHRDWLLDENGAIIATLDYDSDNGKWSIKNSARTVIAKGQQLDRAVSMIGLTPDGASLVYATFDEDIDDYSYYEIDLADGAVRSERYIPDEADSLIISDTSPRIRGWRSDEFGALPVFFNETANKDMRALTRAFPNTALSITDLSDDLGMVVFKSNGPGDSGTWYQLDLNTRRAWPLGQDYPGVPIAYVAPIQTIKYTASDGLAMEMIVTLPPGLEPKNLPVIMMPHGGPHAHDEPIFDWWAQAMASRGYVVVQPNFRGSTDQDRAFLEAGYGEWGGKMQTDLSDALAHLAGMGMVDPKRACIVGASYGGYAALAGVTLQQGVYRCAVSVAGVSDLPQMRKDDLATTNNEKSLGRYFDRAIGTGRDLDNLSPAKHAARADAPILLIHGKDDTVVYINQSDKMADKLKDAGKPFEYIRLDGEDHWLSRGETRLAMLEATMAFILKHNPPGPLPE